MTMSEISIMRSNMLQAGVYSIEDIDEICRLESEYLEECKNIADECVDEGYPSCGSNYELRCEQTRRYYDECIKAIDSKYDHGENPLENITLYIFE